MNVAKQTPPTAPPSLTPRIRLAVEDDVPDLLRIEQDSFSSDRLSRRSYRHLLTEGNSVTLIDDPGDTVRSYITLLFRTDVPLARVYSNASALGWPGAGVAAGLLAAAEELALARSCVAMKAFDPVMALDRTLALEIWRVANTILMTPVTAAAVPTTSCLRRTDAAFRQKFMSTETGCYFGDRCAAKKSVRSSLWCTAISCARCTRPASMFITSWLVPPIWTGAIAKVVFLWCSFPPTDSRTRERRIGLSSPVRTDDNFFQPPRPGQRTRSLRAHQHGHPQAESPRLT